MIRRVSGSHESDSGYRVLTGDVREMLGTLPDESVQCCVTSPPYWGLRDYKTEPQVWGGEEGCEHEWQVEIRKAQLGGTASEMVHCKGKDNFQIVPESEYAFCQKCSAWRGHLGLEPTPELYVEHIVEIFREVRRVLRKDGTLWLNIGDCYASGGRADFGPCQVGTKQATQSAIKSAPRAPQPPGLKPKDLVGIPWRVAFALQQPILQCRGCGNKAHKIRWGRFPNGRLICPACMKSKGADVAHPGWYLRSDVIWAKPNPMPESCRDRPTKAHEYVFLLTKSARYFFDQEAVRRRASDASLARISQSTFNEQTGGPKDYAKTGVNPNRSARKALENFAKNPGANIRTVWIIPTQPFPEAHFATFPEALPERCIRAGTSERGCCPECGAPWERVVEESNTTRTRKIGIGVDSSEGTKGRAGTIKRNTTGWEPSCDCQNVDAVQAWDIPEAVALAPPFDPVPCVVLDPFVGSGTTAIVAVRLGRRAVGIDLNETYAAMVSKQLAVVEPGSARRPRKFRLKGRSRVGRCSRDKG